MLIKYKSNAKVPDRNLINVDPQVFAIWAISSFLEQSYHLKYFLGTKIEMSKFHKVEWMKKKSVCYGALCYGQFQYEKSVFYKE